MQKILFSLLLFLSFFWGALHGDNLDAEIKLLERFSSAYHIIKKNHIRKISSSELINASIKGMVKALDEHSKFLSKEEFELLEGLSLGRFSGIGVTLTDRENIKRVSRVVQGSPAEKAGIKRGDIIVAINGQKLEDVSLDDLVKLTIGEVGTTITVTFKGPSASDKEVVARLIREKILEGSVRSFDREKVLVLQISSFQKGTPGEVKQIIQNKAKTRIIIDLRDNPGGLLLSAVETADLFLGLGKIVEVKDQLGRVLEKYVSTDQKIPLLQKPILLINHGTASAAEILAGTLKERKAGILVGSKSYGKGTVQSVYAVSDEYFLKLTSAKYFTPAGESFDGIGIEPDILVTDKMNLEEQRYTQQDKVYQKALSLLH